MKLSDTQRVILSAAANRPNGLALPLPKTLKGGAAQKVIGSLLKNGLLNEMEANPKLDGSAIWRKDEDGNPVTVFITKAGLAEMGIDLDAAPKADAKPRKERTGTKQAAMIDMLRRKDGATVEEIAAATGWQKHTIRGAMAGALKKKLGLDIASDKVEGRGRVYKIAA
jgi:hypothetical protein